MKRFTTKELVFIALMGALMFTIAFSLGAGLIAATGTPLVGGLIVNLFVAFILVLTGLTVRKFGTFTLILLIHTVLSTPTINFGPPGVYKIIIGVSLGLLVDIILLASKYKKWAYYFSAVFAFILVGPYLLWFLILLGLPGVETLSKVIYIIVAVYAVEALIGTWLAIKVYDKKLKDTRIFRQIRS